MDRVLIVIDNVQFNNHLEYTFRKVGYVTETLQSEYNLFEKVLSFNPQIIVVKGATNRLSVLKIGKKLKENIKFAGHVILIFPKGSRPNEEQMSSLKVDIVLEEPASALKIVMAAMSFEKNDRVAMKDKLYKLTEEDKQYRQEELTYLKTYGGDIEQELIHVKSLAEKEDNAELIQVKSKIQQELDSYKSKTTTQIKEYNKLIENLDVDLNKGLSKRDTKKAAQLLFKEKSEEDLSNEKDQNALKQEFLTELLRKKD